MKSSGAELRRLRKARQAEGKRYAGMRLAAAQGQIALLEAQVAGYRAALMALEGKLKAEPDKADGMIKLSPPGCNVGGMEVAVLDGRSRSWEVAERLALAAPVVDDALASAEGAANAAAFPGVAAQRRNAALHCIWRGVPGV